MKIVINRCKGGFGISDEARQKLFIHKTDHVFFSSAREFGTIQFGLGFDESATKIADGFLSDDFRITWGADQGRRRADPDLVAVVEELGDRASAPGAKLRVFEVPDGADWLIHEFDGKEQIRLREETAAKPQRLARFPEVDRAEWFALEPAREKLVGGQVPFLDRLLERTGPTAR